MNEVPSKSDTRLVRIPSDDFVPKDSPDYLDVFGLHSWYDSLAFKSDLLLLGPKGIGKSLSLVAYASKKKVPIVLFDCSEDIRRSHLMGSYTIQGSETAFVLGALPTAISVANETGHCILSMEEISALAPNAQKILNSITDFRRHIELPEIGRVFRLEKGAKLWVVGTMNPTVYGGVYSLNEDLKSRLRIFRLKYPTADQEKQIISVFVVKRHERGDVLAELVSGLIRLAFETRQGTFEYPLSTRDLIQVLEDVLSFLPTSKNITDALDKALFLLSGKQDGDDIQQLYLRADSIFKGLRMVSNYGQPSSK